MHIPILPLYFYYLAYFIYFLDTFGIGDSQICVTVDQASCGVQDSNDRNPILAVSCPADDPSKF